jgi:3-phenylpropionate/trans-cinnamate dioxygenase ferredoxin reductase component
MFPLDLAQSLNDFYRQKGIEVLPSLEIVDVAHRRDKYVLRARSLLDRHEEVIAADAVVAGLGIRPNTALAEQAGLLAENGICVDAALRTSAPDIFAAGDVAEFFNPALGKRMRVEHEDNANTMGEMAGRAMAGQEVVYDHLPFFYSDLFELGFEAVGEVDSRLQTIAAWSDPYREGAIYYLQDERVRGVLLWNLWERVEAARRLIAEPGPFRPQDLEGRLLEKEVRV